MIEAKITDFNPRDGVSLELASGRSFNDVVITRFSESDQKHILQWESKRQQLRKASMNDAQLLPDSKIQMFVKSARDNDLNDKGDPDNREVEYEPAITFDSKEKDVSFKRVKGTLVFIGESVLEKREFHILYREDFTVDLPANERVKWEGKPFTNIYDDYPKNGSAFGAAYEGYLLILRDKEGTARILKASKSSWKEDYRAILSADTRLGHSKDFSESSPKTTYPQR